MLRLRSQGGKVVVYMEGGGLSSYFLASAADRIIAHPHTSLSTVGMSGRTFYYEEILKKLGVVADFVRIAEYKGTPETYHRTTASDPVRRQRSMLRADRWNQGLSGGSGRVATMD